MPIPRFERKAWKLEGGAMTQRVGRNYGEPTTSQEGKEVKRRVNQTYAQAV